MKNTALNRFIMKTAIAKEFVFKKFFIHISWNLRQPIIGLCLGFTSIEIDILCCHLLIADTIDN